jgi:uncharacterized protein (DUF1330 family)
MLRNILPKLGLTVVLIGVIATTLHAEDRPGFLFVNATVTDSEKLGAYGRALPPVYAKYDGRYLIFGGIGRGIEVIAGSAQHESVIFAQFNSLSDIETFWWSDDYRAVFPLREGAGTFDVLGLEGTGVAPYSAQAGVQPAYLFTFITMKDRDKAMAYMEATESLTVNAPGRVIALVRPDDMAVLEGPKPDFTIEISSWPSMAAIKNYMADPVYEAAIPLRDEAMEVTVLAAETAKPR